MSKKSIIFASTFMMLFGVANHAGSAKLCDKDGLSCEKSSFDFGLTALYFQAYSDAIPSKSLDNSTNLPLSSVDRSNATFNAPWDWGGIIDGRYHFSDKRDVNLNWMYYSVGYNGGFQSNRTSFNSTGDASSSRDLSFTSGKIKLNSVNLEFAQSLTPSLNTLIRLFAGLQYANITDKQQISSSSAFTSSFDTSFYSNRNFANNKYEGVGPRIGLDANYKIKGNFSVFANSAATILLARRTQSTSVASSSFGASATVSNSLGSLRRDIAIPELEARLGLTYEKPLAQGTASVSAGWSVVNYFNLLGDSRSDLTLSGPFVQGKWVG